MRRHHRQMSAHTGAGRLQVSIISSTIETTTTNTSQPPCCDVTLTLTHIQLPRGFAGVPLSFFRHWNIRIHGYGCESTRDTPQLVTFFTFHTRTKRAETTQSDDPSVSVEAYSQTLFIQSINQPTKQPNNQLHCRLDGR